MASRRGPTDRWAEAARRLLVLFQFLTKRSEIRCAPRSTRGMRSPFTLPIHCDSAVAGLGINSSILSVSSFQNHRCAPLPHASCLMPHAACLSTLSAPFPHVPGYSVRLSLPTQHSCFSTTMLGRTTKTYSPEHGKRSHQKMNNRHVKPVRTHDSHTHDSTGDSGNITPPTASALVQPVLKGLDIEPMECLVKGLGAYPECCRSRGCSRHRSRRCPRRRSRGRRQAAAAQTAAQAAAAQTAAQAAAQAAARAAAAVAAATIAPSLAPCSST